MNRLWDYRAFLSQFLRNRHTTGAVMPSGRALAAALCCHVGRGAPQRILEAGPGTGAVTGRLVELMRPQDELWLVELNPTFAAHLRGAFEERPVFHAVADRCHLVEGSIQDLGRHGPFDLIVSGLPLNNFSAETVRHILDAYAKLLKENGILSFFQYILIRDAKMIVSLGAERSRLKNVGKAVDEVLAEREFARERVWTNIPPAWVHHLRY
ncbi:MAG: methyltransferase domain-containing protein [Acidobacteria bacterium]|nr:methyltransferase domain-containing protein [Acidobacteriota bacterium]